MMLNNEPAFAGILLLSVVVCVVGMGAFAAARDGVEVIHGTVVYREKMSLPPDAVLHVALIDKDYASMDSTVLAKQSVYGLRSIPVEFNLEPTEGRISSKVKLGLIAVITDGKGGVLWSTDGALDVQAASQPVEVLVHKTTEGNVIAAKYLTHGTAYEVKFLQDCALLLTPDGRESLLPIAVSASGSRYSDGRTTFWIHRGGATFEDGEETIQLQEW